ncbi:hypothetical protein Ngar_c05040 [Candidatus Nitrososphaera gargensis Ga9.2]|uniref:Uncharacterized protein n=2 Tax=Candidatus Nitrososphaera gargensis TaxID=497727 RepID=K0IF58_NITGG|nr:hypothetical protein Ngar_c05040 [Candidatus Nitrososphaera gargensis Ga9.2]
MGLIQEKLDLLSSMIYHLDKMKYKYDAIAFMHQQTTPQERYAFNQDEWNELVRDIDEKIKNRYYLLNRKVLEKWVWAKNLRTHPKSIEIMPELRKMLVEEYNQIIDKHLNNLQDIVPKITPDEETGSRDKQTDAQESPIK